MEASALTRSRLLPRSRRLLAALGDERLVSEARRGNDAALEVIYDRYHLPLLSFCRHMLRSREDAEDALQHTFASGFRTIRSDERPIELKPWLFTIARNRCLSIIRARREQPVDELERISTAGLADEVERRADLKQLLADVEDLPERQRAALVLSEVGDLGHSDIAHVLECETKQVKALVFQARSSLMESRRARETPCAVIREQLATATGGELRRGVLRRHLRSCSGCAEYRDEIRRQRKMLAAVLPVIPSLGLKESALAAAGIGGGGAAGGGGLIAALGAHGATKAVAVTIATGGTVGGVVTADPAIVDKTRVAFERAATELGASDSSSVSQAGQGKELDDWTDGSFDWEAARAAARRETESRGASEPPAARPQEDRRGPPTAGADPGAAGVGPPSDNPGRGNAYGRGREEDRGRGRGREARGSRGRGRGGSGRGDRPKDRTGRRPLGAPGLGDKKDDLGAGRDGSLVPRKPEVPKAGDLKSSRGADRKQRPAR